MAIFNTCCCCFQLEVGVAIMGWLGALGSGLDIIKIIVALATADQIHIGTNEVLIILSVILHFAIAVCLIIATMNKNQQLLLPWLVVSTINLVCLNIILILWGVELKVVTAFVAFAAICDTIGIYFWLCVYSYYQQLVAREAY